jgi:histidinol dehydrogenase
MRIFEGAAARARVAKLANRGNRLASVEREVGRIVADVRRGGDQALRKYAERWDGLKKNHALRVSQTEIERAWDEAPPALRSALRQAAANIRNFAIRQKPKSWMRTQKGISMGQIVRPLSSVGCYVPGGRYPLPSTLLMTVIPGQVAGVSRICIVSPQPQKEILAAAALLGITEIYRAGGAQAIAAVAYGTESISPVDKIVGPGNLYVTAAKKLIAFDCAIDFLAGPTEVVVVSHAGDPVLIASDLVAQAEHDPEALAVFITSSLGLAGQVAAAAQKLSGKNPTASRSLEKNGSVLRASSRAEAMEWANRLAPEHIAVSAEDLWQVLNAGSVFVGEYSPQAAGDYASGPNHVLPTGGGARFRGGLTVSDFVKVITVQRLSRTGLGRIASVVETLAEAEGLSAHAQSVRLRLSHA